MFQKQSRPDDTTRRLSASVHYDQRRAQELLDLIVGERHRFLVRYDDINTTLVTAYAASAVRMWRRYCLAAIAAVVLIVVANLVADDTASDPGLWAYIVGFVFSTVAVLVVLWLAGIAFQLLNRYGRGRIETSNRAAVLLAWIVAIPIVLWSLLSLGDPRSTLALALFAAFGVYLHQAHTAHRILVDQFQSENWTATASPAIDPEFREVLDAIATESAAVNSTVYSGFTPFVGAGFMNSAFRNALEVVPAEALDLGDAGRRRGSPQDLPPPPPEVQIMAELIGSLEALDLSNFRARRWHFVHGLHAGAVDEPGADPTKRPTGSIDGQAVVDGRISDEFARSYLWLSSSLWGGEVVLNTFVRLVPGQFGMFIEISHHVLPPIDKWSSRCEEAAPLEGLDLLTQLTQDAAVNVTHLPKSIGWFSFHRFRWGRTRRRVQHLASKSLPVDRGASQSIRDLFTTGEYDHYFQLMDSMRYRSIINASLLTKIDDSLRQTGWAIADLDDIVKNLQNITISNSTFGDNANIGKSGSITTSSSSGVGGESS